MARCEVEVHIGIAALAVGLGLAPASFSFLAAFADMTIWRVLIVTLWAGGLAIALIMALLLLHEERRLQRLRRGR